MNSLIRGYRGGPIKRVSPEVIIRLPNARRIGQHVCFVNGPDHRTLEFGVERVLRCMVVSKALFHMFREKLSLREN
jgi:hypothetical protein